MSQVTFRRIGGRIVPIKMGPHQDEHRKAKAAALGSAALGSAALTGKASGAIIRESANRENMARNASKMYFGLKKNLPATEEWSNHTYMRMKQLRDKATRLATDSKRLEKRAFKARAIGSTITGALAGAATHKALENSKLNKEQKAAIGTATGGAVAFGVHYSHYRSLGTSVKNATKHALKRAFKLALKLRK